jgi:hypothetical protein
MGSNTRVSVLTIVIFNETGVEQLPEVGVNIYVAVPSTDILILAGLHVPAIPSIDTRGSAGAAAFWQYTFAMVGKVGETTPTIVMFKETGAAQLPADGINAYVPVPGTSVLMLDGLHVPVIPSLDTSGSAGAAVFWQYEFAMVGKVGETTSTIVMFKEAGVEQLPDDGINVYVDVPRADVLMLAGFHVPVIPSFDISGNAGGAEF